MKAPLVGICWATAVLILGQTAYGQEHKRSPNPNDPMQAIEIRHKQLDIEQRQAEMNFNNEMRKIQLDQKRQELKRQDLKSQDQASKAPEAQACPAKDGWRGHHKCMKHFGGLMALCLVVHLLLTIWVYQDIRQRNAGSGLWIVITLLTGLLGALVYAVARIGEKPAQT